jgi:chitosanase
MASVVLGVDKIKSAFNRMAVWFAVPIVIGLVIFGIVHGDPSNKVPQQPQLTAIASKPKQQKDQKSAVVPAIVQNLNNPAIAHRAEQIISSFENSTLIIKYDVAEDIDDGRGITAGRAGFTSGTGDLLAVIQRYTQLKPMNVLIKYLPALQSDNKTDSTDGLNGFAADWKQAVDSDPLLVQAQDDVYNELYFDPALKYDKQTGISTAVGQLIILDTIVQHGAGDDPDGLPAIIKTTTNKLGKVNNNEQAWLKLFLENRRKVLHDPSDKSTTAAWRESISRVDALESILNSGNPTLQNAISWKVYGDSYNLPKLSL